MPPNATPSGKPGNVIARICGMKNAEVDETEPKQKITFKGCGSVVDH
jgi:hypothetical protein